MQGKTFTDFLIRRTPHYDTEILKDVTPVNGWMGQVPVGDWPAFAGTSRIGHRIRRMFPDLSGCWKTVVETGCLNQPCDPGRKKVGFGFDQFEYHLEETYFKTDLFCFPLILSADAAKEQYAAVIEGLREATIWIWNHRYRTEAVKACKFKTLCGSLFTDANPVWNDSCDTMVTSGAPSSKLTIQFLQRWEEPLILNGYLGKTPIPLQGKTFELVTDFITSTKLVEENPALKDYCQALSVEDFKRLYKYGISKWIGDFMIRLDPTPLRYQKVDDTHYNMVQPYENQPAAAGIGGDVNQPYIEGRVQWDLIWHRGIMRSLVRRSAPINSELPFASMDFGGRWHAVMDNMTETDDSGNEVPVNNEERNKLKFNANFSGATKPEHTEWGVAILSERELSCVVDLAPCNSGYPYVLQDYSSADDPCPTDQPVMIDIPASGPYLLASAYCNDVNIGGTPTAAGANVDELITFLNGTLGAYGTFSKAFAGTIQLTGTTCATLDVVIQQGAV